MCLNTDLALPLSVSPAPLCTSGIFWQTAYLACIQDGAVACAAAQVAVQGLLHLLFAGAAVLVLMLAQGSVARHHHAGRAVAALAAVVPCDGICMRAMSEHLTHPKDIRSWHINRKHADQGKLQLLKRYK